MRYVFPCFPFVFIWLSQIATANADHYMNAQPMWRMNRLLPAGANLALVWSILSSLIIYPHNISYFNELAGGPICGPKHLLNSNIDWGQDLLLLKWWREAHAEELYGAPFHLAYYGHLEPGDLGFSDALPWTQDHYLAGGKQHMMASDKHQAYEFVAGYYVISVNFLQGYPWPVRDGQDRGQHPPLPLNAVEQFRRYTPIDRIGYSLLIYYVN